MTEKIPSVTINEDLVAWETNLHAYAILFLMNLTKDTSVAVMLSGFEWLRWLFMFCQLVVLKVRDGNRGYLSRTWTCFISNCTSRCFHTLMQVQS